MDDLFPFILFDPAADDVLALVDAIVQSDVITVIPETIQFAGATGQSSFYDGSLVELGIDAGILLTSGDGSPPQENTTGGFTQAQLGNTDPDLQAVANAAFAGAGEVQDANTLEFSFTIDDPTINSITFNLVFGSDEFPEFSDSSFVDIAAVFVNGNNVALFNGAANQPLSIIDTNLELGNFIDNQVFATPEIATAPLPIEYDGVSSVLTIFAPVQQGENVIEFAIADTGDQSLDSGLFIANLMPSTLGVPDQGSGGILIDVLGTDGDDNLASSDPDANLNEFFGSGAGNDLVNPGAGDDTVDAGPGDDTIIGDGQSTDGDLIDGGDGIDTVIFGGNFADFGVNAAIDGATGLVTVEVGTPGDPLPDIDPDAILYSGTFLGSIIQAVRDNDNLVAVGTFDAANISTVSDTLVNVELLAFDDTTVAVTDLAGEATASVAPGTATAESGNTASLSVDTAASSVEDDDRSFAVAGTVFGSDGGDTLAASAGDRRLYGGDGDDVFTMDSSARYLGGAGNDTFFDTAGGGNLISGGAGADAFIFGGSATEVSAITDFDLEIDSLTFVGITAAELVADGDTIATVEGPAIAIVMGVAAAEALAGATFA